VNLLIILKSIFKKKLHFLLIGLQVAITVYFLISSLCTVQDLFYKSNFLHQKLNYSTKNIIHINFSDTTVTPKQYYSFINQAKKIHDLRYAGTYDPNIFLYIDKRIDILQKIRMLNLDKEYAETLPTGEVQSLCIDQNVINIMPFKIIKGRTFRNCDFKINNKAPVPIIVGYDMYRYKLADIGSQFYDRIYNRRYIVIGVAENNSKWFYDSISSCRLLYLNDKFIVPKVNALNGNQSKLRIFDSYCILKGNASPTKTISKINSMCKRLSINAQVTTVEKELENIDKLAWDYNIKWIIFLPIFIFMASLGSISVMLSLIMSQQQEIGVRMAFGYSIRDIEKLFIGELLITSMISTFATILYSINKFKDTENILKLQEWNYVSPLIIIAALIGTLIITLIPSIIIVLKIRKVQPRELIGGNE
jgi:putative ABC transport system permease protein